MQTSNNSPAVTGEFITLNSERFYAIKNVDQMAPFFISLVSESDHWLFVSSNTGLTAGRVSPQTALFTYETVDRIHESHPHTGCKTIIRKRIGDELRVWEPFNKEHNDRYTVTRNIYKTVLGHKVCFEETNHDLELTYRYTWATSDQYGFVRTCDLINLGEDDASVEVLDGFQNVLPAGTPRYTQTNSSNLVDAYKWTELEAQSGLGIFSLFSGITDRAEPCESLNANTVFSLGLQGQKTLLSSEQLNAFKNGETVTQDSVIKGIRGAYLSQFDCLVKVGETKTWHFVTNIEQSQSQIVELIQSLNDAQSLTDAIQISIDQGTEGLAKKMAAADGFQSTNEETVSAHHYANVLFNVLRGGIFDDQYTILSKDYVKSIRHFNEAVYQQHSQWLQQLPETLQLGELSAQVLEANCSQLERLTMEYLPITFGRRHGDPSRPWNHFEIKLVDENNEKILSYQGNWRDIFQNWEALTFSYPDFIEGVIAKFVNASTVDGYNPYRITKEGIDWEVEDPDDPWSYIGYWGDHQIIYLQKLLELSKQFHPTKLSALLRKEIFCYANVPYRIKSHEEIKKNAKDTVLYDNEAASLIDSRVEKLGADGKLVLNQSDEVYQVNLVEKLCVTLLSKLGNLILGGGIWLNTQRPEWNDANNALVGQGVSVVTLCYMRRYTEFLVNLLSNESSTVPLSSEVAQWLIGTSEVLAKANAHIEANTVTAKVQLDITNQLGELASAYRHSVYEQNGFSGKNQIAVSDLIKLLDRAETSIDYTIAQNKMESGLFHAYNLLSIDDNALSIDHLYPMLEGQVAALSSGYLNAEEANSALKTLFASDVYRDDQKTFMLYPDRQLPSFLEKNKVPTELAQANALINLLVDVKETSIIAKDANGDHRFNGSLTNVDKLKAALSALPETFKAALEQDKGDILRVYEAVFNHKAFTGRSGGMFGFEGLGCIYWHMVSKLLLAVQECYFDAVANNESPEQVDALAQHYYKVREGIGFNKTPSEYGAFPVDPYSHTPKHSGAQQPGMTGQVKEEVLTRFGELGIRVSGGQVNIEPSLLRACEFKAQSHEFKYLDVAQNWQTLALPERSLGFTWCQVPIVYEITDGDAKMVINTQAGAIETDELTLPTDLSESLFSRNGKIQSIRVSLPANRLSSL